MNLFNHLITWLAHALVNPKKRQYTHRGRSVSRAHAVQLKRQKANKRLHSWYRAYTKRY